MNKVLLALVLSFFVIQSAKAQVEFTFSSDTTGTTGSTVDVDVSVSGFVDIISMQLSLNWDATVFSFASIENITDNLADFSSSSIGTPDNAVVLEDGEITLSWSGPGTQPRSLPDGSHLFTVRLEAVGDLCDRSQVVLSNSPREIEVVDNDFNILDVTGSGGDILIYNPTCPGNGGGQLLTINLDDLSASGGSSICIPVTAENFTDILSFQSGVTWDPTVLEFSMIRDAGLQSVTANSNNANQGELNIVWLFDQNSVTLSDGATLFEICFNVIGNTGETTPVSLGSLPDFDFEISNSDGKINEFEVDNAIFTVGSNGMMTGVGLIAPNIFTENNPSVCIPVTTKNFTEIGAFQAGVNFDPSILTYTGINQASLSGVDVGDAAAAQGDLRILWQADFSTPSVTLPDDSVLFELCFDVVGSSGERSSIGFVNLPDFAIEFSSEIGTALDFFVQDGSITVGTAPMADLSLTVSDASVNRGEITCVDITATGFTDIQGMGFALEWDADVITYVEQRNYNLSNLGDNSFSLSGTDRLRVLWTPVSGQTVADGTSLFQVCYQATDTCGTNTSSTIAFIADNTPIEIIGPGNQILNPELNSGTVSLADCGGAFTVNVISTTQPSCTGNTNGVVNVDFSNATGTVMCTWTRASDNMEFTESCNLLGVGGGSYTLVAIDEAGEQTSTTVNLVNPDPIDISADVIDGSCTTSGQITLIVSGGTINNGTYTYQWSDGLPPNSVVTDLSSGTYNVTVTDANNCTATASIVVADSSFAIDPVVTNVTTTDPPNGAIDLNPTATNLTYNWSTGATTSSIADLDVGTYMVTVTDPDNTCTAELSFTVDFGFVSGEGLVSEAIAQFNGFGVSCNGVSDGSIEGDIEGGCSQGPVTVMLNGNVVTLPLTNLPAGEHVLRIEDACQNTYEETFILEEPDPIVNNDLNVIECPDGNSSNGIVELDITGGTGVYSFSSSVGNQTTGTRIENLPFGPFTVVVQDENGCQVIFENLEIPSDCRPSGPIDCVGRAIISPNGDNVNDVFEIACLNNSANQPNNLTVYDRWGNLVMESSNYNNDWEGIDMSGEPLPEGGYMWVLTTGGPGSRDIFRGTVSILR